MKSVTKGWLEAARDYIANGTLPGNSDWHELMVEHLLLAIDELTPKVEPKLTQDELKAIRKILKERQYV